MNQIEALKFLGIDSILECEEAIENKIFEIKQEIISNCHVPQLILAKQKKLKHLVSICETLIINFKKENEKFEIEPLNSESMLDSFNLYHKNRALILQKIASNSELHVLIFCSDLLLQNLRTWAQKWPKLEIEMKDYVKLSKELESVEMLRLIKELNRNNILFFNDIESNNIPKNFIIEIIRLNQITTFFK